MLLNTNVLTPSGWKQIKDIHINDILYDGIGKETRVINELYYIQNIYEISFIDDSKIQCSEDQYYNFTTYASDFKQYRTLSVYDMYYYYMLKDIQGVYQLAVPINKPVQFVKKQLDYNPYIIGILINTDYLNKDNDILFTSIKNQKAIININELTDIYNCFENININNYLYSSVEDRLNMLQGLIAAYGEINKYGKLHITLTDINQYENIKFLINSLGYRCKLINNNIISILNDNIILYTLDKHKYISKYKANINILEIKDIKNLHIKQPIKYLQIDSPQHTYICDNFIIIRDYHC